MCRRISFMTAVPALFSVVLSLSGCIDPIPLAGEEIHEGEEVPGPSLAEIAALLGVSRSTITYGINSMKETLENIISGL